MKATRANGLVVGVADAAVGCARDGRIVTYALGSCIGLTAYDPVARVGGMLHFMLPQPAPSSESAILKPAMYGSTGVPMLTERLASRGADPDRLVLVAAGAAEILAGAATMAIGKRNHAMLRKVLWRLGLELAASDIGGSQARTMSLDLTDGAVRVRVRGEDKVLWREGSRAGK